MAKKKLVVLSGAGISAESGIATFRDSGGLWEGHDVNEVATLEAWYKNRWLVLNFYNQRRKKALQALPNRGHKILAELEEQFDVTIVTQNIDDLHERAASSHIIHLHGELFKARSTRDPNLIYDVQGWEVNEGDLCELGSQLRPHIVWFGEPVPMMDAAIKETTKADIFIVVGTSLLVHPAASLLDYVSAETLTYIIDPNMPELSPRPKLHLIEEVASIGLAKTAAMLNNR